MMKKTRIIVFAKAPIPGFAKTRLIPALGPDRAAGLARRMCEHAVHTAVDARIGIVELCVTPTPSDPAWHPLALPDRLVWSDQGEGDLGARMARAAERTIRGGESVLLIGTDCPHLNAAHLRDAAHALHEHDTALAPAADGGYALLGLKHFHPLLFDNMPWSTETVALETLFRLGRLGWTVKNLQRLHDIDEPADLKWLPEGWCHEADPPTPA